MNIKTQTIFTRDNLEVMRGIDTGTIDLIYMDPPFNKKKQFHAPVGSEAEGASWKDWWTMDDIKGEYMNLLEKSYPALVALVKAAGAVGHRSNTPYLLYMAPRLIEAKRLLRDTGWLVLHCDDAMSHPLKLLCDGVFGWEMFSNDVTWQRTRGRSDGNRWGRIHDDLLFFARGKRPSWNPQFLPLKDGALRSYSKTDERVKEHGLHSHADLTGPGISTGESGATIKGFSPGSIGRCWALPRTGEYADYIEEHFIPGYRNIGGVLDRFAALEKADLIYWSKNGVPNLKRYLNATKGSKINDIWTDIPPAKGKRRTGYPTQKPLKLLDRIIRATTDEGGFVLEPFCGCATGCVAAEMAGRHWCGIDVSPMAGQLVKSRLAQVASLLIDPIHRTDIPTRTGKLVRTPDRALRTRLYGEQKGNCNLCKGHFVDPQHLQIDHIVAKAAGGADEDANIQLLCGRCNSMKGKRSQAWAMEHFRTHYLVKY